ncbi:hypothetical protein OOK31_18490 [Streptomyces sp. NBC_00249]|uniref:hypothetical protein n=1 Tax=Streptomyces sp. NBC_00249 TaxID=2975690 RepID=UPI00224D73B2|nr:hypothetical protein [Streptomyces sp. NBC_00249]MCX5195854.1 hypothetical protein [Streptomyces sp. NBC_00249]
MHDTDLLTRVTGFTAEFGPAGGYRGPDQAERTALVEGVSALFDGNTEKAGIRLAEVGYRLDTFTDGAGGRRFAEVADARPGSGAGAGAGAGGRGWGRIYLDLGAPPRWSVQIPHPVADQDTERLGAEVLRSTLGGVMVLAGAHRKAGGGGGEGPDSGGDPDPGAEAESGGGEADEGASRDVADMAHRTDSVFHAVIAELTRRGLPGIQLHGFADSSVPGADAVVSTGAGTTAAADAGRLAEQLQARGVRPCRSAARSADCRLAGRTNEQGRLAAEHGTCFLHLELARSVRADPDRMRETAYAIAYVTAGWAGT